MQDQLAEFLPSKKQRASALEIDWQAKKEEWVRPVASLYARVEEMLTKETREGREVCPGQKRVPAMPAPARPARRRKSLR